MKAISLWEPWASAIRTLAKRHETRHWSTRYRGPLVIHAAKRNVKRDIKALLGLYKWQGALAPLANRPLDLEVPLEADYSYWRGVRPYHLSFGKIVAILDLVDCIPTERVSEDVLTREGFLGNYDVERFAWKFESIRPLSTPIPFRGAQGFFDVPEDLLNDAEFGLWIHNNESET